MPQGVQFTMTKRLLTVALFALCSVPVRLIAECREPPPVCESLAKADLVFWGEVLDAIFYAQMTAAGPLPDGLQAVKFNIITPYKGVKEGEFWGVFTRNTNTVGFRGGRYLVFAHRTGLGIFSDGCTHTRRDDSMGNRQLIERQMSEIVACPKP
jgi:hypothetical protein